MGWFSRRNKKPAADGRMTAEEMSQAQRELWERAEQAVREYANARGADVAPARERMLRMADEAAVVEVAGASERQVAMWRLAAEEIREFVAEALARHPEARQN